MSTPTKGAARYGMAIDLDKCTGCGSCTMACSVENNVAPLSPAATHRTGVTPMRVHQAGTVFFPVPCQHCGDHAPCVRVCPQTAVDVDTRNGVVSTIPVRCLGCRYCMTACPFEARYFHWWDPKWPEGMEVTLNPDVSPRMRGTVEKCNFCHGRRQAAEAQAAHDDTELGAEPYVTACQEACPAGAITFSDLNDPKSEGAKLAASPRAFRLLEQLGTDPKIYYLSDRPEVRRLGRAMLESERREVLGG